MNWYLQALKKYADFSGRARRKEYWVFVLFNIIISVVLTVCDVFVGTYSASASIGTLSGIYSLAGLIPGIPRTASRLQDPGRSCWGQLVVLAPVRDQLVLLLVTLLSSP